MSDLTPLEQALLNKKIEAAKNQMTTEQPDLMSKVSIKPAGMFDRVLMDARRNILGDGANVAADTSPHTGNITYYPEVLKNVNQSLLDSVMAHELVHSKQALVKPFYKRVMDIFTRPNIPYNQEPDELEAYQAEIERAHALGLPAPSTPNFSSKGFHDNQDIVLPKPKFKKSTP